MTTGRPLGIGTLLLGFGLGLTGCTSESAVQKTGDESYAVTGRSGSGSTGVLLAQSSALQTAREYCTSQGRRFQSLGAVLEEGAVLGNLSYTLHFRCPVPRSPATNPTVRSAPGNGSI